MILLMVISGGLYLLGVKGKVMQVDVDVPPGSVINLSSNDLEGDVRSLLKMIEPAYAFEYLKISDQTITTRPTSRAHYEIKIGPQSVQVSKSIPSVQKSLIELHKGHGPRLFKLAQKFMAGGLLIVLLSGVWLGLSSHLLRARTAIMLSVGTVCAIFLTLFS